MQKQIESIDKAVATRESVAQKLRKHAETIATRIKETEKKQTEIKKVVDGKDVIEHKEEDVNKLNWMHRQVLKLYRLVMKAAAATIEAIAKLVNWLGEVFSVTTRPISSAYEGLKSRIETEVKAAA